MNPHIRPALSFPRPAMLCLLIVGHNRNAYIQQCSPVLPREGPRSPKINFFIKTTFCCGSVLYMRAKVTKDTSPQTTNESPSQRLCYKSLHDWRQFGEEGGGEERSGADVEGKQFKGRVPGSGRSTWSYILSNLRLHKKEFLITLYSQQREHSCPRLRYAPQPGRAGWWWRWWWWWGGGAMFLDSFARAFVYFVYPLILSPFEDLCHPKLLFFVCLFICCCYCCFPFLVEGGFVFGCVFFKRILRLCF